MNAKVTYFPVDNGDMTHIQLCDDNETSLLIDCKIRNSADDETNETYDVSTELRTRLKTDSNDRPYVDAFLLSHPDEDHCKGLEKHFWLGSVDDYCDDDEDQDKKRIVIRQIWSSPMVFRRASKSHTLCSDAKAFNKEAKRRVQKNIEKIFTVSDGDKILILGEDENGKTDDLSPILIKTGQLFSGVNESAHNYLTSHLLAPIKKQDSEDEDALSKNNSSVIISFEIKSSKFSTSTSKYLTGGDAGVHIWERISEEYTATELQYDLLLAPHHCSWRSLSHDSWSKKGEDAQVSEKAKHALSHANYGAFVISSSKPVKDDDSDPPCIRAKREYRSILGTSGIFKCTGEEPNSTKPKPLELEATSNGFKLAVAISAAASVTSCSPPRAGRWK